jgi:hypothetical protein
MLNAVFVPRPVSSLTLPCPLLPAIVVGRCRHLPPPSATIAVCRICRKPPLSYAAAVIVAILLSPPSLVAVSHCHRLSNDVFVRHQANQPIRQ